MRLLAAKVSSLPKDDLVGNLRWIETTPWIVTTREADSVDRSGKVTKAGSARMSVAASLPSQSEVTAVLPMRLNRDALKDLVLLNKNSDAPIVIVTQPAATYVVNVTGNSSDVSPGNGVCLDTAGNCTFSAAIQEANAHAGADTIEFNIPGAGIHTVSPRISPNFSPMPPRSTGRRNRAAAWRSPLVTSANFCSTAATASYVASRPILRRVASLPRFISRAAETWSRAIISG